MSKISLQLQMQLSTMFADFLEGQCAACVAVCRAGAHACLTCQCMLASGGGKQIAEEGQERTLRTEPRTQPFADSPPYSAISLLQSPRRVYYCAMLYVHRLPTIASEEQHFEAEESKTRALAREPLAQALRQPIQDCRDMLVLCTRAS